VGSADLLLRSAAFSKNSSIFDDGQGDDYELSRQIIVEGLETEELSKTNSEKMIGVMKEFVKWRCCRSFNPGRGEPLCHLCTQRTAGAHTISTN
jgi:hypothetical protein